MKHLPAILLLIIFGLFSFFIIRENSSFEVLEILSPTEIVIDFNKNKLKDNNETITIKDIYSFSIHPEKNKISKISSEDGMRLGFLAENYANEILAGKNIKFKDNDIYVNNTSYKQLLMNKGYATNNGLNSHILDNLNRAKQLNLVILNKKNYKYHKLDCKYGRMAHNYILIPASQLSDEATPCKYCHTDKKQKETKKEKSQSIKQPDLVLKNSDIELFLTDMSVNLKPNNKCLDRICQAIVREIDLSKDSIDFAIYGYSKIPKIENALLNAQKRGVKIRFVFDTDGKTNIYPDTFYLAKIFPDNNFDKSKAIMHNKFFIFDNKKVFTGSANLSNTDMSGFSSNSSVLINSKDVAQIYTKEFEQMYNGKFHETKHKIKKDNKSGVYFSPKDDIIYNELIPLVNGAKKYIYIPTFIITHEKLAQSLIAAKQRGVDVKIILDATNTKTPSKISQLRNAGIPVKTENFAGKLHSKSLIIDDEYIVIGSMNFSVSGAKSNDENVMIIKDEKLAKFYKDFFVYLWNKIPDKWLKYSVSAESKNSAGSCSDGIDNDYDGDIDMADSGCKK